MRIIERILHENGVPASAYSIGSYAEESVCMERRNGNWDMYEGERGNKYNLKSHIDTDSAFRDLISRVAKSHDAEKQMLADLDLSFNAEGL